MFFFNKPKFSLKIKRENRQACVNARLGTGFGKMVVKSLFVENKIDELQFVCARKGIFVQMNKVTPEEAMAAVIDSLVS